MVREILDQGKQRLLFDLSRMDYISSAGLRVVLMTVKELQRKSGQIVLCALRPYVKEVFEVSNFATIIPITDSVEAGLKKL
jgi:stage II sporulation protein AA (anti-sigma F factor antagonist)